MVYKNIRVLYFTLRPEHICHLSYIIAADTEGNTYLGHDEIGYSACTKVQSFAVLDIKAVKENAHKEGIFFIPRKEELWVKAAITDDIDPKILSLIKKE